MAWWCLLVPGLYSCFVLKDPTGKVCTVDDDRPKAVLTDTHMIEYTVGMANSARPGKLLMLTTRRFTRGAGLGLGHGIAAAAAAGGLAAALETPAAVLMSVSSLVPVLLACANTR